MLIRFYENLITYPFLLIEIYLDLHRLRLTSLDLKHVSGVSRDIAVHKFYIQF